MPLLISLAVLAGVVRGNLALLQAIAVTGRWGTADYGRLSALLGAPAHIAAALFEARDAGAADDDLKDIVAEGLQEQYFKDNGRRAQGLIVDFTDIDYIDLGY